MDAVLELKEAMVDNYRALEIETLEVERITAEVVYETGRYRYHRSKEPMSLVDSSGLRRVNR